MARVHREQTEAAASLLQFHAERGVAAQIGPEFHHLLFAIFADGYIHRLLHSLGQIRDLQLPVGARKSFKVEFLHAQWPVPDARCHFCGVNRLQVAAGYSDERGAGSQVRRNLRGHRCGCTALGASRRRKERREIQ